MRPYLPTLACLAQATCALDMFQFCNVILAPKDNPFMEHFVTSLHLVIATMWSP